ncbi:MAG: nucleotidyltransferase family protein [Alphaproteobacteria bacterium]
MSLRLLTALLRAEPGPLPTLNPDQWNELADLVIDRHRVAPAIAAALAASKLMPPDPVRERIEAEARANGFTALRQKAETGRIIAALAARGCHPVLLKGWPLAEELMGSAAARHSKDIDLYIARGEIATCLDVLGGLGYQVDNEHKVRAPLVGRAAFAAECNDLALWHAELLHQVEIHWRSNHFRGWADLRDFSGTGRDWPVDETGTGVRIPSVTANLIYLALHGQQHAWLRLKWLHDIALIMRRRDGASLVADLEAARQVGAARAVVAALHLAQLVFGDAPPPGWPAPDRIARHMLGRFVDGIAAGSAAPGTPRARFDFYWVGLVMAEGLSQRLGVLRYAFWRGPRLFWAGLTAVGGRGA